jgi:hypothetical protein
LKSKSLWSTSTEFDWQQNCFVCGQSAIYDQRHPDKSDVIRVESLELEDHFLTVRNNIGDEWRFTVSHPLHSCIDLVAAEARYHRNCNTNFACSTVHSQKRRPVDSANLDAFNKTCEWLESTDSDLLTLAELMEKSKFFTGMSIAYSERWLKCKLLERYGARLFFADIHGRKNVICWRDMASFFINEKWYSDR